ncbi:MAG TPA: hypothetical protein VJ598_02080, partial [Albitalea sp.]|nr:hypothetical protein [Albitalea sp.]
MRRHLVRSSALLGVALLATAAQAQSDDPWRFDATHTALAYATQQEAETDGPYNSGNRLARIPRGLVDFEWREDWRLTRRPCNAQLDLRLLGRKTVAGGDGVAASEFSDGYARTAGIACRFGAGFEARVGREVLQWGNATFRSPSNPFFVDTGKTHPIRELLGKDMLQLGWRSESGWAVSAVRNVGVGDRDDAPRPYRPISALRVDYVGATRSAGAIATVRDGGRLQLGGYLTQTLSDAL